MYFVPAPVLGTEDSEVNMMLHKVKALLVYLENRQRSQTVTEWGLNWYGVTTEDHPTRGVAKSECFQEEMTLELTLKDMYKPLDWEDSIENILINKNSEVQE